MLVRDKLDVIGSVQSYDNVTHPQNIVQTITNCMLRY